MGVKPPASVNSTKKKNPNHPGEGGQRGWHQLTNTLPSASAGAARDQHLHPPAARATRMVYRP